MINDVVEFLEEERDHKRVGLFVNGSYVVTVTTGLNPQRKDKWLSVIKRSFELGRKYERDQVQGVFVDYLKRGMK